MIKIERQSSVYIVMGHDIKSGNDNVLSVFADYQNAAKRAEETNKFYTEAGMLKYTWVCHRELEDMTINF